MSYAKRGMGAGASCCTLLTEPAVAAVVNPRKSFNFEPPSRQGRQAFFESISRRSLFEKCSTELDQLFNQLPKFSSEKTLHFFIPEQSDLLFPNEVAQLYLPPLIDLLID